ncbi:GatB/YqeY domain-containing protein [Sulfurimonas sp. MAG313]|nr:GatB/YqeY domain-containing protein [Sulfurimonas sp. MAG313]MDF1881900.1 GatB/YqeY domain-containing protein [Sulfurimonas sp. MAG313]
MSALLTQIKNDMKEAMKAKEVAKRDALRLLLAAVKQIEVDERKELTDEDVNKIIQKQVKQRQDSAAQFKEAGRDDLLEKEESEIAIFMVYMPKQLDDTELENTLKDIIKEVGASTMKDIGKVMGKASKSLAGKADGKRINECVKSLLG